MKFYHLKTFYQTFLHSQRNLWIKSFAQLGLSIIQLGLLEEIRIFYLTLIFRVQNMHFCCLTKRTICTASDPYTETLLQRDLTIGLTLGRVSMGI